MIKASWIVCVALFAAGCASSHEQRQAAIIPSSVPIRMAPNSALDTTRGEDLTTIELLKEKAQEIVTLKKRNRELELALTEASQIAKSEGARAESQSDQVRRLQTLLARITGDQTSLNDRVLSLEIEKHELEKKILNIKMASLAAEGN